MCVRPAESSSIGNGPASFAAWATPDPLVSIVDMETSSSNQAVLERIRAEYLEMPGLRLTVAQVTRLCGVERSTCTMALDSLVDAKFLCLKSDGAYARLTDGEIPRPRPAKAGLRVNKQSATAS
jgi:hypothetical protein